MVDHAAAILCGLPHLSFPGRRIVVLRRNAEAEEADRAGPPTRLHPAQLIPVSFRPGKSAKRVFALDAASPRRRFCDVSGMTWLPFRTDALDALKLCGTVFAPHDLP